jgi:hypothetical protein
MTPMTQLTPLPDIPVTRMRVRVMRARTYARNAVKPETRQLRHRPAVGANTVVFKQPTII